MIEEGLKKRDPFFEHIKTSVVYSWLAPQSQRGNCWYIAPHIPRIFLSLTQLGSLVIPIQSDFQTRRTFTF